MQTDPVAREVVQFNISAWSATLHSSNDEAGPFLYLTSGAGGTGTKYYSGYGPVEGGSSAKFMGTYVVSVPVTVAAQYVYFNLSLNDNESASSKTLLHPLTINSKTIDLMGTATGSLNTSQSNASMTGWYKVLRVGEAANTLLWVPGNNTTLSSVPWGLKRYTAEPDFDLRVLNVSATTTLSGIEGAEGGWHYPLTLQQGLNNILVPRGAFINSPLGQALVNNTNETLKIPSGAGVTFTPADWSGRTETSGSNPVPTSTTQTPNFIWVFSSTSQLQNGSSSGAFGGLPQNPSVESSYESRQVQAVFWINITSSGNGKFSSVAAELDDLFGGLTLNRMGSLTGNLVPVTSELGTLGLPGNVLSAPANVTLTNGGAYAPPHYNTPPPPPPWWQTVGSAIYNTLSGVANAIGLTYVISVVWNNLAGDEAFIGEAATWLSNHLGITKLANQFVANLRTIASAMVWALQQFLVWLGKEVVTLLTAGIDAATFGITSSLTSLEQQESNAASGYAWAYGKGSAAPANATGDLLAFLTPLLIGGAVIGVVLIIGLTLLLPFSLGTAFLFPLLVPIIMAAFGLGSTLALPSSGEQGQASRNFQETSGASTSSLIAGDASGFNLFESPATAGRIQPPSEQTAGNWLGYVAGGAVAVTSGVLALIAGSIVSGTWGPVAGWAGFILAMIALCLLLPLSIIQYSSLPSTYSPSDAAQFRQLQVTDIELSFFAFSGIVLSLAGLFSGNAAAIVVAGFGAVIGLLAAFFAWVQVYEVQDEIDGA